MRIITNITNSNPAVVTTSFAHQYISGTIVRLDVPPNAGMIQIDQQFGPIVVLSPTTFSIAINSTHYDTFVPALSTAAFFPQAVPIGEVNEQLTAAVQNVLPYS